MNNVFNVSEIFYFLILICIDKAALSNTNHSFLTAHGSGIVSEKGIVPLQICSQSNKRLYYSVCIAVIANVSVELTLNS